MSTARGSREEVVHIPETTAPAPNLTVAAVARRLGVAPPTLRTWDRRYGLGPSEHTAGAHRRYSPSDVARLMVMRRLTLQGVAPADAARLALGAEVSPDLSRLSGGSPVVPQPTVSLDSGPQNLPVAGGWSGDPQTAAASRPEDAERDVPFWFPQVDSSGSSGFRPGQVLELPWRDPAEAAEVTGAGGPRPGLFRPASGGGRVVAMPDGTPRNRGLARAAMSLDTTEIHRLLVQSIRSEGVVDTWTEMIMPVLRALGERTISTGDGIDVEHAFSEAVLGVFRVVSTSVREPRNLAPVLLACADRDYHSLPLHALAAALAERMIIVRMLGTGLPPAALAASARRTGPSVIALFARMPGADAASTEQLRRQRPAPAVVLCGPGWEPDSVPQFARRANSLSEAVDEVVLAAQA